MDVIISDIEYNPDLLQKFNGFFLWPLPQQNFIKVSPTRFWVISLTNKQTYRHINVQTGKHRGDYRSPLLASQRVIVSWFEWIVMSTWVKDTDIQSNNIHSSSTTSMVNTREQNMVDLKQWQEAKNMNMRTTYKRAELEKHCQLPCVNKW